jgi:adenylate cyclase
MTQLNHRPAVASVITWLAEGARTASEPQDVLEQLCSQLHAAGLAIDRCAAFVRTLHPNIMGRRFLWNRGEGIQVNEASYDVLERDTFLKSPVVVVQQTGQVIRLCLDRPDCQSDYNVVEGFRAEGFTDYVIYSLDFLNGQHHPISWSTKRAGGFDEQDIETLMAIREPLARIAEIYALKRTAGTLLDAYVGHGTGLRILDGQIRRGDIETIYAAILMADLRGFTAMSNDRPAEDVIDALNSYFDGLVPAIEAHGGEILKFIGDGLLAIFAIEGDAEATCDAALQAAMDGQHQLQMERNGALRCGMALHLGNVLYGNIGSQNRLDFTAIGPAVNLTARLEPLTRDLGRPILTSAAFANACRRPLEACGSFRLRGFDDAVDVFAPSL